MTYDDHRTVHARARLAGFLYLFVNVIYVASLLAFMGSEELRRPAIALMTCAAAGTIVLAWSFYELVKPAGQGLALLALLFRGAEAALFGVIAIFSLRLLGPAGPSGEGAAPPILATLMSSGQVPQVYFCAGSAIFFYLLWKGRFIPRALAMFGLAAMIACFASVLAQIVEPGLTRYLRLADPLMFAAELLTGIWLLVAGAGRRHMLSAEPAPLAG